MRSRNLHWGWLAAVLASIGVGCGGQSDVRLGNERSTVSESVSLEVATSSSLSSPTEVVTESSGGAHFDARGDALEFANAVAELQSMRAEGDVELSVAVDALNGVQRDAVVMSGVLRDVSLSFASLGAELPTPEGSTVENAWALLLLEVVLDDGTLVRFALNVGTRFDLERDPAAVESTLRRLEESAPVGSEVAVVVGPVDPLVATGIEVQATLVAVFDGGVLVTPNRYVAGGVQRLPAHSTQELVQLLASRR